MDIIFFLLFLFIFSLNLTLSNFTHVIWLFSNSSLPCKPSALTIPSNLLCIRDMSLRSPLLPHSITFHTFTHCSRLFFSRSILVYSYFFQNWETHTTFSTALSESIIILILKYMFLWILWGLQLKTNCFSFSLLFFPYHIISSYWSCGQLNSLRLPTQGVLSHGTIPVTASWNI